MVENRSDGCWLDCFYYEAIVFGKTLANKAPSPEVSIRATWKIRQLAGEVEVRRGNAQVAYGHFQKCLELSDGTIPPSAFGPLSSYLGLAGRTLGCVPQGAGGLRKEGALASSTA